MWFLYSVFLKGQKLACGSPRFSDQTYLCLLRNKSYYNQCTYSYESVIGLCSMSILLSSDYLKGLCEHRTCALLLYIALLSLFQLLFSQSNALQVLVERKVFMIVIPNLVGDDSPAREAPFAAHLRGWMWGKTTKESSELFYCQRGGFSFTCSQHCSPRATG